MLLEFTQVILQWTCTGLARLSGAEYQTQKTLFNCAYADFEYLQFWRYLGIFFQIIYVLLIQRSSTIDRQWVLIIFSPLLICRPILLLALIGHSPRILKVANTITILVLSDGFLFHGFHKVVRYTYHRFAEECIIFESL